MRVRWDAREREGRVKMTREKRERDERGKSKGRRR